MFTKECRERSDVERKLEPIVPPPVGVFDKSNMLNLTSTEVIFGPEGNSASRFSVVEQCAAFLAVAVD